MQTILYISYDGLCEPLGQSQIYQYLVQLSKQQKYRFELITFEKPQDFNNKVQIKNLKKELESLNIAWHPLKYHRKFSVVATFYDIIVGFLVAVSILFNSKIKFVHVRSYVPAMIALFLKIFFSKPFIFDMRGFWVDEKVDVGSWPRGGILYKVGKFFERQFLTHAHLVISLTNAAIVEMKRFPYLKDRPPESYLNISTCVNLDLFKPHPRKSKQFTVGYVGGASAWYDFDLAIRYYLEIKRRMPDAKFLIINKNEQAHILERLAHFKLEAKDVEVLAVSHKEMPNYISQIDIVVFFIQPYYSKTASAPTKLGELLACGVPSITNGEIGDMGEIISSENVGVVISDKSEFTIQRSVDLALELLKDSNLKPRCLAAAEKYFSLSQALQQYDKIYSKDLTS